MIQEKLVISDTNILLDLISVDMPGGLFKRTLTRPKKSFPIKLSVSYVIPTPSTWRRRTKLPVLW